MNYNAVLQVPAKYLGGDVNRLIGQINDAEVNQISIPVTANIGGTFSSPLISTDLTSGVSSLTKQLVEIQKQKMIGKGKDKINDLLGNVLGGNNTKTDSTDVKADSTKKDPKEAIKEGVDNVLGRNPKRKKEEKR